MSEFFGFYDESFPTGNKGKVRKYNLKEAYKQVAWVYACVNIQAESIASVPITFFTENSSGEEVIIDDVQAPINQLFSPPDGVIIDSLTSLKEKTLYHRELFGEAFWMLEMKGGVPINIKLKSTFQMRPIFAKGTKQLIGWEEFDTTHRTTIKVYRLQDVILFKAPNPYDEIRGLAPLEAARLSTEQEVNMSVWNASFFEGSMRAPIAVILKQILQEPQRKAIIANLKKNFMGFIKGQGPLVVDGATDVKTLMSTLKDMDFIKGKRMTREEICAIYKVPPSMVGIFEYANYANAEVQEKNFWKFCCFPKMRDMQEKIQLHILDPYFPGIKVKWELETVEALQEDEKAKAEVNYIKAQTVSLYKTMNYPDELIGELVDEPLLITNTLPPAEPDESNDPDEDLDVIEDDEEGKYTQISYARPVWEDGGTDGKTKVLKLSDSFRDAYSELYNKEILPKYESRWLSVIFAYLNSAKDTSLSSYKKGRGLLNQLLWNGIWRDSITPIITSIYVDSALRVSEEFEDLTQPFKIMSTPIVKDTSVLLGHFEEYQITEMEAAIRATVGETVGVSARLISEINILVQNNIAMGQSITDLTLALESRVTELYSGRASTIARTTTGTTYNTARYSSMIAKGGETHTWISGRDTVVRDTHRKEDSLGKLVTLGDLFPITKLRYPNDPAGKVEEVVNCRCTTYVSKVRQAGRLPIFV